MGNYCEQVVHSRYLQLGLQPTAGHSVLLQISYCKAVALCGHDTSDAHRWNSMRRAATLCMPVMGVARADGLYGHG